MTENNITVKAYQAIGRSIQEWATVVFVVTLLPVFACGVLGEWPLQYEPQMGKVAGMLTAIVVFITITISILLRPDKPSSGNTIRVYVSIQTIAVGLIVTISGGALDSPFTAVLGLFVSAFIFLQSEENLRKLALPEWEIKEIRSFNKYLLVLVATLLIAPYALANSWLGTPAIASWKNFAWITWSRLFITIGLFFVTAISANNLSRKLSELDNG